ncbi:hypothetical protein ACQRXC_08810 [Niallia taxi]|uniref:hypothetical protein n=1 Tax=Niallia taxi TaxID=2499688 RepID=UPI003F626905
MAITTSAHTKLKTYFVNQIKEGRYFIGSTSYKIDIFQIKQSGDQITVYLYLNDSIKGSITKYQLIDVDGAVFDDAPDSITKTEIQGVLVAFRYTLTKVSS